MQQSFEQACKKKLLACAEAYARQRDIKLTTLGRIVVNDSRFFSQMHDGGRSFTVRKYDEILRWFSQNWAPGVAWPDWVERPALPAARDAA
ncbi:MULTISPECIES: hypothetical protein [unclassified Bradyrhizobium]|uniref:hypothetical protein n=1 Tax=unclassified Bradyrhizobium TaxID=2631580 RepID=UPI001BA88181|nr:MULTISPECIES: hypothetical protein [unclassified Bradyrhizobium]MBR1206593.1 hypothetical protein [Bradyrhizobium sp. AUGA SZCCT0124]MBR1315429.1 hypothetical protein [Bradyrhizobium sp. AUGA SZCCT0051]MBR1338509.1 hypothetical protein [Bradyrhizobium sp. AUGA SZCCT0105]MBR1356164.1 hypothetical protein [Bradyrhizobium sp. AUGA SZCCT0045]